MSRIKTTDLALINDIKDDLELYESGFPVLKEIIQNANDSGSSKEEIQLDFGLSPGIPCGSALPAQRTCPLLHQ